jgi:hypothetical protein
MLTWQPCNVPTFYKNNALTKAVYFSSKIYYQASFHNLVNECHWCRSHLKYSHATMLLLLILGNWNL